MISCTVQSIITIKLGDTAILMVCFLVSTLILFEMRGVITRVAALVDCSVRLKYMVV